jgi:hemoglobin
VTKLAALATCLAFACGGHAPARDTSTAANQPHQDKAAATAPELYERLGGQRAIVAVVDDFIDRVANDSRIKLRFVNTDIPRLKSLLVEFVCMATGGPCHYSGRDMETTHAGMELVDDEFTAIVEDLAATLDKFKVPAKEKNELLGALAPLKPRIVTSEDHLHPVNDALIAKANALLDKITDPQAHELMQAAITAAKRGQRNYADQLFGRVEIALGAERVAGAAQTFRDGAPPRIDTPLKQMPADAPPQPQIVGSSDEDSPSPTQLAASLHGTITVDGKPLTGVGLVELYPANGKYPKRTAKYRIVEQRDKKFWPRLLAVPPGSTVAFPNYDDFYHNVFSNSSTQRFDLGMYKNGQSREMKFDKPGLVRLGCNVHASMASFIFIIDAPAYVPVDGSKEFGFKSLEPGKYKARVWSEYSAEPLESEIKLKDGVNVINFDVKGDGERGPSKDKFGNSRQVANQ